MALALGASAPAPADTLRFAFHATELDRDGPGLLLRDLLRADAPDIDAVTDALVQVAPDFLGLSGLDHDAQGHALRAFQDLLHRKGLDLPYAFAAQPNAGLRTPFDLNGDGRVGDPQDAQGFGTFPGQGGLAVLSRLPILSVADYTDLAWAGLPWADPPRTADGGAFPTDPAFAAQRLPYLAHWRIDLATDPVTSVILFAAAPPVFDGPEDRNGRRNADEIGLAQAILGGWPDGVVPDRVVVMGTFNLDPADGQGRRAALRSVLADPRLQDPQPRSEIGVARAARDGGINARHRGDPGLDTADFREDRPGDPGNLRVDYVLPDRGVQVTDAGLTWPAQGRRAVVWVAVTDGP